ncbi:putative metal-binding motif-containing protein [Myxococcota bacterium]|nr:putative metal-binding motif-containing protein [Myxococcota bacterium]
MTSCRAPWVRSGVFAGLVVVACAPPAGDAPDASPYVPPEVGAPGDAAGGRAGDAMAGSGGAAGAAGEMNLPVDPPDARPPAEPCGEGDADGDGYGTGAGCAGPDCDDTNAAIHPDAIEACNALDEDCDGVFDEGLGERACGTGACRVSVPNCVDGRPAACAPPAPQAETCNGLDDDCDGATDEGAGVTTCGVGACERRADCVAGAEGACTPGAPAAETCNALDDDCDGVVDNGFRAVVHGSSYGVLATHHDVCNGVRERIGPNCNAAMSRFCAAQGCTVSGFGPVENSGDAAAVTCVAGGQARPVAFATLAGIQPACDGAGQRIGPECNSAIHRFCRGEGFTSGFGPVESGAAEVTVICVSEPAAQVVETSYGVLSGHHGPCNQGNYIGPDCNAAIHRFCGANGFASGFGPVEHSGDVAVVTCVRP